MHLQDPASWAPLWLVAAGALTVAEMVRRLRLFFLPFAVGALVAALTAWLKLAVVGQWLVFLGLAVVLLAALRPLARRLALGGPHLAAGSNRWIGQDALVEETVPSRGLGGWVRLGRERWRAESGLGVALPAGTRAVVSGVEGGHLVVLPADGVAGLALEQDGASEGSPREEGA